MAYGINEYVSGKVAVAFGVNVYDYCIKKYTY